MTTYTHYVPVPHRQPLVGAPLPPYPPWRKVRYRWVRRQRGVVVAIGEGEVWVMRPSDLARLLEYWSSQSEGKWEYYPM